LQISWPSSWPNEVIKYVDAICKTYPHDNIPPPTYPWIALRTDPIHSWKSGSGPLEGRYDRLLKLLKPIRKNEELNFEREQPKFLPRNHRSGHACKELLARDWIVPRPSHYSTTPEDYIQLFEDMKLPRLCNSWESIRDRVYRSVPKRGQASLGATVLSTGAVLIGDKGQYWDYILEDVDDFYTTIDNLHLTWDFIHPDKFTENYQEWDNILASLYDFFVPAFRTNGKPDRPRLIVMPNSRKSPIEQDLFDQMESGSHSSPYVCNNIGKAVQYQYHANGISLMSDFSHFDWHVSPWDQWSLGKAQQEYYNYPESIMIYLTLSLMRAPYASHLGLIQRFGANPSGDGKFAFDNTAINLMAQREAITQFGLSGMLCLKGDNTVIDCNNALLSEGPAKYGKFMFDRHGFIMKPEESFQSRRSIIMLKTIVRKDGSFSPVIMSRARNALLPEWYTGTMDAELTATSYRAQSFGVAGEVLYFGDKAMPLLKFWHGNDDPVIIHEREDFFKDHPDQVYIEPKAIAPEYKLLYNEYPTDQDLVSALLPKKYARGVLNELLWAHLRAGDVSIIDDFAQVGDFTD
jgi:hypothetical protein